MESSTVPYDRQRGLLLCSGIVCAVQWELAGLRAGQWWSRLHKVTKIRERLDFDVRLDAFNLFNRVKLGGVGTNGQDGNFGQPTGLYANPRNFQGAIKLSF